MPSSFSQPGIYNILDYGAQSGGSSNYARAQSNVTAIQKAINQAIVDSTCATTNHYGAIILIPSNDLVPSPPTTDGDGGIYYLSQTAGGTGPLFSIDTGNTCSFPLLFLGTSAASRLYMLPSDAAKNIDNDVAMFQINNTSATDDTDVGGISFQDLWLEYDLSLTDATADYAIYCLGSQNVRLFRCVLDNVSGGVYIVNTTQFSMIDCTGIFDKSVSGTMLTIGDNVTSGTGSFNAYVAGCQFRVGEGMGDAGTTTVGLTLGACDILRVVDCRFDGFTTGVVFQPSFTTMDLAFTNISLIGPGTQVSMIPGVGNKIQGVCFTNCNFTNNAATGTAATLSAVIVDSGAGHNSTCDGIRFVSCVSVGNPAVGLELRNGQNFEILGGIYSSNSQSVQGSTGFPGIWLNGGGTRIRITGASCVAGAFSNTYPQPYGIEIGAWTDVFISNCDATGYTVTNTVAPFKFSTPGAGLEIVNCAGYNDQGTEITFTLPSGSAFSSQSMRYYGPVVFYLQGGSVSSVVINSVNTHLTSGTFMLPPGDSATATITYVGTPPNFVPIGM